MKCIKCNNNMRLDDKDTWQGYTDYYYICDNCSVGCVVAKNKYGFKEVWCNEYGEVINLKEND